MVATDQLACDQSQGFKLPVEEAATVAKATPASSVATASEVSSGFATFDRVNRGFGLTGRASRVSTRVPARCIEIICYPFVEVPSGRSPASAKFNEPGGRFHRVSPAHR